MQTTASRKEAEIYILKTVPALSTKVYITGIFLVKCSK